MGGTSPAARAFMNPPINEFHDHLDVCRQCREHPFGLCKEGERLLYKEAAKAVCIFPEDEVKEQPQSVTN